MLWSERQPGIQSIVQDLEATERTLGSVLNVGDVTRGLLQEWYNLVCLLEEPSGCGLETKLCGRGGSNKKRNKKRHRKPIEGFIAEILPEMIGLDQRQEFWLDGIGGENEKEK